MYFTWYDMWLTGDGCHLSYWQWAGHVYGVVCHIDSEQAMFMKSIIVNIFGLVVSTNKEIQVQNTGNAF